MAQFQLLVAAVLVVCSVCSAGLLFIPLESKIQLTADNVSHDPFDVTKPEDIVDGEPVDEASFWQRMRFRKLSISVLVCILLVIQIVSLASFAVAEEDRVGVVLRALRLAFVGYIFVVAARSIRQEYALHSRYIVHLSVLTSLAISLLGTATLLPSSPMPVTSIVSDSMLDTALWYTSLVLYLFACILIVTTPRGPPLHFPPERIYSEKTVMAITSRRKDNVSSITGASVWDILYFNYTTRIVTLANTCASFELGDLPIVPGDIRAIALFAGMRTAMRRWRLRIGSWQPKPGSGWELAYILIRANTSVLCSVVGLTMVSSVLFYAPAFFMRGLVRYLEADPERINWGWGWMYCAGMFFGSFICQLTSEQLFGVACTTLLVRLRVQVNSILFAKTLVRKDITSSAAGDDKKNTSSDAENSNGDGAGPANEKQDGNEFSSKAQIMTLMTIDVSRVSALAWHIFYLFNTPIEIVVGTLFLYSLLGVSCLFGLAVIILCLPLNHFTGSVVVGAQGKLMKARDERIALMNEILGSIRMIKFMAWERSFEARVLKIRDRELKYQKLSYTIETLWNALGNAAPILVTLVSFWHFTVVRKQVLTPSIAFTSISVFDTMKGALNSLPETMINLLQSWVSIRRIETYLQGAEVDMVATLDGQSRRIALQSATITWSQDQIRTASIPLSGQTPPRRTFALKDLTLDFPPGELSLICGKLGSGKSLLLLALLGEAEVLSGSIICPQSPPDGLTILTEHPVPENQWIVQGLCAYVPQSAWLRNASIKENILFELPYIAERYQRTLEVCALIDDLKILEDGDMTEIGDQGINLSGGQKARVSLARAVYSHASLLLLDDVLSAVDAHTALHLYNKCLRGDLMTGRTVILVSHHIHLCASSASYIVALDNGSVRFQGNQAEFFSSDAFKTLGQSEVESDGKEDVLSDNHKPAEDLGEADHEVIPPELATLSDSEVKPEAKPTPRKFVEEEKRAVGAISKGVWWTYLNACGSMVYWATFLSSMALAAAGPVLEAGWLKIWSGSHLEEDNPKDAMYYITIYTAITALAWLSATLRWFVIYTGSIHASRVLYQRLLENVLFASIRFHDTVSRGRLLNRFGKDFEGIDSSLPGSFGQFIMAALAVAVTLATITFVGGIPFLLGAAVLVAFSFSVGKVYSQTSKDLRRLDSVTLSPLYSMYGEAIAGAVVIRAFGASSKFMRNMLRCVDTNINPQYWTWRLVRWQSSRFCVMSNLVIGVTAIIVILYPGIPASTAAFALAFALTVPRDTSPLIHGFVSLERSMVAVERSKEYTDIVREKPEYVEPRPPTSWPLKGEIKCEGLVIRYAPDLPDVLHNLTFDIKPGEKVGVLGRTGSGKSTLALSFFRFVEPTEGRILIDGLDISKIGLTDLRSKLTIIPQDPTILSGTLRSTLDVFNEYDDKEIYEALRRVHLIPAEDAAEEENDAVNANVFRNLDSNISEGGENLSAGEKQLLCMARAILKRTKVLVMDEATASVDYATDELIGKTIRHEFAESTILTIAHRLRTIIDYDRVILLDQGSIAEFDKPARLLSNPNSRFYSLCKATGKNEFAMLKKMAGV